MATTWKICHLCGQPWDPETAGLGPVESLFAPNACSDCFNHWVDPEEFPEPLPRQPRREAVRPGRQLEMLG